MRDAAGREMSDELLAAIGALAVACTQLQEFLIALVAEGEDGTPEALREKYARTGVGKLVEILKRRRGLSKGDTLAVLLDEAVALAKTRHRVVHDLWFIGDQGSPRAFFWEKRRLTHRPVEEIRAAAARAIALIRAIAEAAGAEIDGPAPPSLLRP